MRVLLVYAASVVAAANAVQVAFSVSPPDAPNAYSNDEWSFTARPALNSTSHLIFDTVASALQHWPHTRYRNGHTLYPATLPPGTLLYHGTYLPEVPKIPEWTATDPEHSYLFCRELRAGPKGPVTPVDSPSSPSSADHHTQQSQESSDSNSSENENPGQGCYHLTLVSTRPLRLLYFDGSSAAKMQDGPMDSQDLVAWGEVKPEWAFKERERLTTLCTWANAGKEERRVDGFVRMEMDFEIMLCDFTSGVEVVSLLNLRSANGGGWSPPKKNGTVIQDGMSGEEEKIEEEQVVEKSREKMNDDGDREERKHSGLGRHPHAPPPAHQDRPNEDGPSPPPYHNRPDRETLNHDRPSYRPPPPPFSLHGRPHHAPLPPPPSLYHLPPHHFSRHQSQHKVSDDLLPSSLHSSSSSPFAPSPLPASGALFASIESGSWHNHFPGEMRIQLDYTRLISFYDAQLFPSLSLAREKDGTPLERWDHRLEGISPEDVDVLQGKLAEMLGEDAWATATQVRGSGVDWKTLLQVVVDRYAERLEVLMYLLGADSTSTTTLSGKGKSDKERLANAYAHLRIMLSPYILYSTVPPSSSSRAMTSSNHSWAAPVFKHCATTHTSYLSSPSFSAKLTYSEKLLLRSIEDTNKEICRFVVGMWAEAEEVGVDGPSLSEDVVDGEKEKELVTKWREETDRLMKWLDWSMWVKCRPACSFEELCYLPTWPFFRRPGRPRGPSPPDEPNGDEDWLRPEPRCVPRMPPDWSVDARLD